MAKPNFSTLLGWQDFNDALFAQTRAVDEVRRVPSYGSAVQSKLVGLEEAINSSTQGTTSGINFTQPADVTVTADYFGVLDAGEVPFDLVYDVKLLGISIVTDGRLDVVLSFDGVIASEISPGTVRVTAVTKDAASITYLVEFADVAQGVWRTNVTRTRATLVVPPPPDPDLPPPVPDPLAQTPNQNVTLDVVSNVSGFSLLGFGTVNGGHSYQVVLNSSLISTQNTAGSGNAEIYIATRLVGSTTWSAPIAASVVGSPASIEVYLEDLGLEDNRATVRRFVDQFYGFISITETVVLPSGSFDIGFFGKQLYDWPVSLDSPAGIIAI